MELRGKRISLNRISHDDLDFLCQLECDGELWFFEEDVPSDKKEVRAEFLKKIEESETGSAYDFVITLTENEKTIRIGLAQIWSYVESRKSWEIGFALLPAYTGKGYACEAVRLLLQFAFDTLAVHKVVGMCNSQNTRSIALMEHVGMTREGIFKEELFWQDQWTDQYFYSILDREFLAGTSAK
jgi:[ribosomal protein S5]-alanine N-acetyltransferase